MDEKDKDIHGLTKNIKKVILNYNIVCHCGKKIISQRKSLRSRKIGLSGHIIIFK